MNSPEKPQPPAKPDSSESPSPEDDAWLRPTVRMDVDDGATVPLPPREHRDPGAGIEASVLVIAHPTSRLLGSRFRLPPNGELIIGRNPSVLLSFPEVASISRNHARLLHDGRAVHLVDLGSTNGTLLNGRKISGSVELESGDRFQVGEVHFKFLHEADPENAYHQAILQMVATDGLTAILNRRAYDEAAEREIARCRRHRRALSLVLFDVDRFKTINDELGHLAGDSILMEIAGLVAALVRKEDVFARVGGEEFAILCPETDMEVTAVVADRIRQKIEDAMFLHEGARVAVTCSFGVASLAPGRDQAKTLYDAADRALYSAKRSGRNRVVRFEEAT